MSSDEGRKRISALRAWLKAHPSNDNAPVHLDPPGSHARTRPTAAQVRGVRQMIEMHSHEVANLSRPAMAAMMPLLDQAKHEVARDLRRWLKTVPDGSQRYTAQRYSQTLLALRGAADTIRKLDPQLAATLKDVRHDTAQLASGHLVNEVARMSAVFDGMDVKLHVNLARIVAVGDKFLLPEHRTSAARYAGDVMTNIRGELAKGMLVGETVHEMTDRLVRLGGPVGRVALRGIDGEPGAVSEEIAEGLFKRYRWWAQRIVRDQVGACYTFQALASYFEARRTLPDLEKRWDASVDRNTCAECANLDGAVVPLDSLFPGGVDGAPLHSCCRCRTGAWRAHWSQYTETEGMTVRRAA